MDFNFKVFSDGATLAIEQIKKEPLFYILSVLILAVAGAVFGGIVGGVGSVVTVGIANAGGGMFIQEVVTLCISAVFVLIFSFLMFPFTVGMFRCIKMSVNGEKPAVPMVFMEYKNLPAYILPGLMYAVASIVLMIAADIPKLFAFLLLAFSDNAVLAILVILCGIVSMLLSFAVGLYLNPVYSLLSYDISEGRLNTKDVGGVKSVFMTFSLPLILWVFLAGLLASLGLLVCCVGILVTAPAGMIIAWHVCRVFRGDDAVTPSQPQEESKPAETV